MSNPNYDQLLATTLAKHEKTLVDNVFNARVLLWLLSQKERVKKVSGGHKIVEPLIYEMGNAGSYGEWDAVTINKVDGITAAEYPWRLLQADIVISGLQELQNRGAEAVINLLEAKVMQAEETLKEKLNVMLFGDGTGNSGKDFLGLMALVDDTTEVGGIDPTDPGSEYWASYVEDLTGVTGDDLDLRRKFVHAINKTSKGNDRTSAIITTQEVYEEFESQIVPQARFVGDRDAADAGFLNLSVHNVPIYWDVECPAGTAFGLNLKYLKLVGHSDRWFRQTPFSQGLNVTNGGAGTWLDARYALILTAGNMTMSNRARQWRLDGILQEEEEGGGGDGGGGD